MTPEEKFEDELQKGIKKIASALVDIAHAYTKADRTKVRAESHITVNFLSAIGMFLGNVEDMKTVNMILSPLMVKRSVEQVTTKREEDNGTTIH